LGIISSYSTKLAHLSLRPYIRHYYVLRYACGIDSAIEQVLMPNGYPEALFVWNSGLSIAREKQSDDRLLGGIAFGQLIHTHKISFLESSSAYGIVFTPLGFQRFVTDDVQEVCDRITSFDDLHKGTWGPFAWLSDQRAAPELSAFATRADAYFSTMLSDGSGGEPRWLRPVLHEMFVSAGLSPVRHFRDIAGVSERQFENKFAQTIGCRPKQFLQTLRFAKFLARCESGREDIISLANECGFYDQAHLCHEIKRITGFTPQQYIDAGAQLFGK
jgi:hypothetical protein